MTGLTESQAKVLAYLVANPSPSLADICRRFGWASTTSARCVLQALERKGYVRREKGVHRSLEVLKQPSKETA